MENTKQKRTFKESVKATGSKVKESVKATGAKAKSYAKKHAHIIQKQNRTSFVHKMIKHKYDTQKYHLHEIKSHQFHTLFLQIQTEKSQSMNGKKEYFL